MPKSILLLLSIVIITTAASSQSISTKYFSDMKWRCIGPHRGGRTVGAVGVPSQPNVFYIGVNNGGI